MGFSNAEINESVYGSTSVTAFSAISVLAAVPSIKEVAVLYAEGFSIFVSAAAAIAALVAFDNVGAADPFTWTIPYACSARMCSCSEEG